MKRVVTASFIASLSLASLVACGGETTTHAEPATPATAPAAPSPPGAACAVSEPAVGGSCEPGDGSPASTLERAKCLREGGHLVDGLREAQKALELGLQQREATVMKEARAEVRADLEKIPHVTFFAQDPDAWWVQFDGATVDLRSMKKYSVDPGLHSITTRHRATNAAATQTVCLAPGELKAIPITN